MAHFRENPRRMYNLGAPQSNYLLRPSKQAGFAPYLIPAPSMGEAGRGRAQRFPGSGSFKNAPPPCLAPRAGAGNGIRTRDTKLGKLVLYQLSYARSTNIYTKMCARCQGVFPGKDRT